MFDNEVVDTIEQPESTQTQEVQAPEQKPQPQQETSADRNFRALREKAEKAERERDEAIRLLQEREAAKQQLEEDDDIRIGPDDLAEGKHLTKVQRKIQKLESQLKQYQQVTTAQTTEARIKSQFPDFEQVVTKDNIELFKASYPEIAATLNTSTDLYNTAVSAYTLLKKFGFAQEQPYNAEKQRVEENISKPRPVTSISPQKGDSPMSRANAFAEGLTEDLKTQLLKEMHAARKNY